MHNSRNIWPILMSFGYVIELLNTQHGKKPELNRTYHPEVMGKKPKIFAIFLSPTNFDGVLLPKEILNRKKEKNSPRDLHNGYFEP